MVIYEIIGKIVISIILFVIIAVLGIIGVFWTLAFFAWLAEKSPEWLKKIGNFVVASLAIILLAIILLVLIGSIYLKL